MEIVKNLRIYTIISAPLNSSRAHQAAKNRLCWLRTKSRINALVFSTLIFKIFSCLNWSDRHLMPIKSKSDMDMRGFRTSVRIIQCKKFLNKLYASYFLYPRYTLYNILPGFTHITGIVSWRIFGNDSPIKPLLNNRMLICENIVVGWTKTKSYSSHKPLSIPPSALQK